MYDKFSPRAQRILIALAQDEAYFLGSSLVEPEHIILALLKSADGLGYVVLQQLRVNVLTLQLAIEQSLPSRFPGSELKTVPNSDRTDKYLDQAARNAKSMSCSYVGTEHLLLAAVAEENSLMWTYFRKAGISLDQVKKSILDVQRKIPSSAVKNQVNSGGGNFFPSAVPFMSDGREQRKQKQGGVLQQFSRDLTQQARDGQMDPVVGREKEIARTIQILSRRTKNNPVLVGEPGVGKTAIVESLAQRIASGRAPQDLLEKRILQLDLAAMVAGTKYRGEFEERIKRVMKEVKEAGNIILFIDELHTVIGAGGPEGSLDASNMIKPALSRGEMQIIGATTTKEYRKYFEKDSALVRRFQVVKVEEPTEKETEQILIGLKRHYENFHHVVYDDDVIPIIARCSKRYVAERFLPDKALDVLDEAGAAKKLQEEEKPDELIQLEQEFVRYNEQKSNLVASQEYEKAAALRDHINVLRGRIDELNRQWKSAGHSKVRHVSVDDVRQVISFISGVDVSSLDEGESQRLLNMEQILHQEVVGQDEAVRLISSAIRRSRAGISSPKRPMGSFIFLGPTGVGKTQLAKTLAKFLFGTEEALVRVDMSDYMERHNASRLVGSPPGYVGHEEGGVLTEQIRQKPYSVVLFDEVEKAHRDVFNLMLQLLEEGEIQDSLGHRVSFRNTVVIMTSNAGARKISAENRLGFATSKDGLLSYDEIKSNAMEELKRLMPPELLNRIDDVVVFGSLTKEQVNAILDIQLADLQARLSEKNLDLVLLPAARDYLVEKGYEPTMGARPMRRLLQNQIEDPLATLLLEKNFPENGCVSVDLQGEALALTFTVKGAMLSESSSLLLASPAES